jgi:hypothetical protein
MIKLEVLKPEDIVSLLEVSSGRAVFGESAYDPAIIWGWMSQGARF